MENYLKVELGRTNIFKDEIIVELAESKYPAQNILPDLIVGSVVELNKNVSSNLDLFINGNLAAKVKPLITQEYLGVKIDELIDKSNDILNSMENGIIKLDVKKSENGQIICGIFANGVIIAKGMVVVIDENFAVRIEEIN